MGQIVLTKPSAAAAAGSFLDIMRHPTLRIHVIIMYFNWFTTAFIMYGLALSWQNLTGGLFLNFIIGTILDFPAKTLAMVLANKVRLCPRQSALRAWAPPRWSPR